jgi:hypothetical protein
MSLRRSHTSKSETVEPGADDDDVIITEEPVPVVEKKAYDLMDDLMGDAPASQGRCTSFRNGVERALLS